MLEAGTYRIGKSSKADVQIPDPRVSRHHANLIVSPVGSYIIDVGSTNGTYVNGRRITAPVSLARGDSVQIGKTIFEVR